MSSKVYCFIYFDTDNKFGLITLWIGLILALIGYPIIMLCYILISIHQYRVIKQIQIENSIYSQSNSELKKFLKHQRIKGSFQVLFTMGLFLLQTGPQLISYLLAGIFKVKRGPYEDFIIDIMFRLTAVTNPLLILLFHNDFCSILKNIVANRFSSIFPINNKK
ncbi:hypothetical protein CONCODRAFT_4984 [Conidiobolus coronatus NRRL 28638]|uniref:G-protein coupled receptors family 1 profile domain-containing protein n=1 Tax=Conidiobolus coronatus (strain ATCC 28846 / CBS 209.66 / NRRL 28638) TaxID=796925 RepID=A0A137PB57_CONC2|nr:hypothetical protein CONCODRAFT_4984 [Conidiobolus coronatus NRRL 28638]|eukprot:KXN72239.1 hypothetical protein CONCODRAFT_4984 [Conidiobolus coronatus NRRL 28638]